MRIATRADRMWGLTCRATASAAIALIVCLVAPFPLMWKDGVLRSLSDHVPFPSWMKPYFELLTRGSVLLIPAAVFVGGMTGKFRPGPGLHFGIIKSALIVTFVSVLVFALLCIPFVFAADPSNNGLPDNWLSDPGWYLFFILGGGVAAISATVLLLLKIRHGRPKRKPGEVT